MAEEFNGPVVVNGTVMANGNPAGQFKGHVGVEGNLDVLGNIKHARLIECGNLLARSNPGAPGEPAGQFKGHVGVEGNLDVLGNINSVGGDCAEEFDVDAAFEHLLSPGTVVVLSDEGSLRHSDSAYDKCVAGIVSGGGDYKPAIILDNRSSDSERVPVALMGKVACKVDATYGAVGVGDLLTTSDTPGHAMKANDSTRAFGAVIGKALRPLHEGRGLVPVLVCLQ
ncbi:hypothetical protein [Streptomyces sp. NPDC059979]|uniref:hypothetical protein n=1 Tax=unclassified Streptomyces TaxID=2593676 RepID=UPI00365447DA